MLNTMLLFIVLYSDCKRHSKLNVLELFFLLKMEVRQKDQYFKKLHFCYFAMIVNDMSFILIKTES